MAEQTHEVGYNIEPGLAQHVIDSVRTNMDAVIRSPKEGYWNGEFPVSDESASGVFFAARNLLHTYKGSDSDPHYPCTFYLENGNDSIGVRFQPGSDEQVLQVVSADRNGLVTFTPLLELAEATGDVTALRRVDYAETRYETLQGPEATQAYKVIAAVIGAARWDFVFRQAKYDRDRGAIATLERSFVDRQAQIDHDQKQLDADREFFSALKKYRGSGLAATILMQAYVRLNGVKVAVEQADASQMDKYDFVAALLTELAEVMPDLDLSHSEVQVAMRYLSDLKHPHVVDIMSDNRLQRFAEDFHRVYNGVAVTEAPQ